MPVRLKGIAQYIYIYIYISVLKVSSCMIWNVKTERKANNRVHHTKQFYIRKLNKLYLVS